MAVVPKLPWRLSYLPGYVRRLMSKSGFTLMIYIGGCESSEGF